jgi:hypothetical protein
MVGISTRIAGVVTAALAAGLLGLFIHLAVGVYGYANDPPRLADVVPTSPPTPSANGSYPQQYRGSFDPNARSLAILAIVSPLLTTVVGFYFGQRTGEAGKAAVVSQVNADKAEIKSMLMAEPDSTEAMEKLHIRGILPR